MQKAGVLPGCMAIWKSKHLYIRIEMALVTVM